MVSYELKQRMATAFTAPQIALLADWAEEYQQNLVKVSDFTELKEIVRDLGETQRRTEVKVAELVKAQQRTEVKVGELVEAQRHTDAQVAELVVVTRNLVVSQGEMRQTQAEMQKSQAETQKSQAEMQESQVEMQKSQVEMQQAIAALARGLDDVRSQTGSNSQTLGYMLENEAYRNLPAWLEENRSIEVVGRMIRRQIGNEEINLLVEARQGGEEVVIVGESKSRLHLSDFTLLTRKVEEVKRQYADLRGRRIQPLLISHFASEKVLQKAARDGVIVVQSFEW